MTDAASNDDSVDFPILYHEFSIMTFRLKEVNCCQAFELFRWPLHPEGLHRLDGTISGLNPTLPYFTFLNDVPVAEHPRSIA